MQEVIWFVNFGVTTRHLFECKLFYTLRDANNFVCELPTNKAFNIIRQDKTTNKKLAERIV